MSEELPSECRQDSDANDYTEHNRRFSTESKPAWKMDPHYDREMRRAALNLMEDAIAARSQAEKLNDELQQRIVEQAAVEATLRATECDLQLAVERYRQLNSELDGRVQERTRELADSEERLSILTAELKRVEHQERLRLARVLHDHVQQLLVAAKMRVDLVATNLGEPEHGKLTGVMSILRDAIAATRDLSVQLAPPLLHDQGLIAALDWLATRMREIHGQKINLSLALDADPGSEHYRDILFHAAQEFLLNAAKHSGILELELSLRRWKDQFQLEVSDRGGGFDPEKVSPRASFGLLQLRKRLENAGGELRIEAAIGKGTRVIAELPGADLQ